jgi:hypothetical protein
VEQHERAVRGDLVALHVAVSAEIERRAGVAEELEEHVLDVVVTPSDLLRGLGHVHAHVAGQDVFGRDFATYPPTKLARIDSLGPILSVDHIDPAAAQSTRVVALSNEELCTVDFRAALEATKIEELLDPADPNDVPGPTGDPDSFARGSILVGDACLPHALDAPTRVRLHGAHAVVRARGRRRPRLARDQHHTRARLPRAARRRRRRS